MSALQKLEALKDAYGNNDLLDDVLAKLLDVTLSDYQLRLKRYDDSLTAFEKQYEMDSEIFYSRFESGALGDAIDFFEWSGLYELRQDLMQKIRRLEQVL